MRKKREKREREKRERENIAIIEGKKEKENK